MISSAIKSIWIRSLTYVYGALLMFCSLAAFSEAATPVEITLSVDLSSQGAEIAPEVYGQFIEHAGDVVYKGIWVGEGSSIPNIRGIRKDVVDALKPLEVPLLRWPGGCFADQYNWRDGIGPRDKRPKRFVAFYNEVEPNAFGTHEFLDFAELIGAKPYISLNLGSMKPLDSVQWLEYINGSKDSALVAERQKNGRALPWNVKYVGLGNEIWGCGGNMRPETAADETRRYGFYIDPDVVRDSPGNLYKIASGPSYNFPGYKEFTEAMMRDSVNIFGQMPFQALSLHYYAWQRSLRSESELMPATGFSNEEWLGVVQSVMRMEDAITTIGGIMDKYDPQKKIALAFDEWDPSMKGSQITLLKAQLAALALNIFHRHSDRVRIASTTFLINIGGSLIQTNGDQMILTPVYHVFNMYKPFKGAKPYSVGIAGNKTIQGTVPMVDASAARARDGKLYLALVNLDPSSAAEVLTNLTGKVEGQILTAPELDSYNEFGKPAKITPAEFQGGFLRNGKIGLRLPAKSIVVIAIS
jgi:alpha-N-arabinofuranosidase